MLNFKKMSQAMLIACGLAIASFPVFVYAQTIDGGQIETVTVTATGPSRPGISLGGTISGPTLNQSDLDNMKNQVSDSASAARGQTNKDNKRDQKAAAAAKSSAEAASARNSQAAAYNEAQANAQAKKQVEQQKREALNQARDAYNANVNAAQKKLDDHVDSVNKAEQKKIAAAQQAYDNCSGAECARLYENLQKAKADRNTAVEAAKQDANLNKQLEAAKNDPNLKGQLDAANADWQKAASEHVDAAKQAADSKANLAQENKKAEKAAAQAKKADDKIKKQAEKDVKNAKADMEKFCEGGKKPDPAKCQKAKDKMAAASEDLKKYNEKYPAATADASAGDSAAAGGAAASSDGAADAQKPEEPKKPTASDVDAQKGKYEDARKKYNEAAEALQKCKKDGGDCDEKEAALAAAKQAADDEYKKYQEMQKNQEQTTSLRDDYKAAQAATQAAKDKVSNLENALKEAKAACEHFKKLTSKQGKADAEKYCGMADQLEKQLADAKHELMLAEAGEKMAKQSLDMLKDIDNEFGGEHWGQEYKAFSTSKDPGVDAAGRATGRYAGTIEYSNTDDVFSTITRRAARILVGLKPIVYTFAGFGLIGFAFMAIFNKISWKWFSNIAIGLFLVANMGRLIEYMVYTVDDRALRDDDKLSSFGDYLHKGFADTEYAWVDEMTPYVPPAAVKEKMPITEVQPPEEAPEEEKRGFCRAAQKGGGLFGGGGFASCVKDLISAGKKAVDTVKKVQNTVDTVKNVAENVKFAAQNIGDAVEKIGQGNLEDSFNALGQIGQNVNYIVGSTGGAMGNIMSNVSDVTNNIQDISKSTDQQAALQEKRNRGEATNKIDAALKGQKLDADGNVERRWGGNLEYDKDGNVVVKKSGFETETHYVRDKDGNITGQYKKEIVGEIASNKKNMQNTGQLGFMDITQDVVQKSQKVNNKVQEGTQTAGALVGGVANFSAFGSKSINEGRQERQAEKRAEKAEAANNARAAADAERVTQLVGNSAKGSSASYDKEESVQDAKQAAATRNQANSAAVTAENAAKRAQNEASSAAATAKQLAEKAAKTGLEADKIAAEQAQKAAERAARKATEAQDTAADAKAKAAEAEKAAHGAAVKATQEVRDKAKTDMEDAGKKVSAAQKALTEAQASGDEGAIRNAKAELSRQQNAYDKVEATYYQAAAKHASLTEDKTARAQAEQKLKDEKTAAQIVADYEKKSNPVNVATAAKNELRQAENEAVRAKGDAANKAAAAEKAQKDAEAAQKRAAQSGLQSDKDAAKLAQVKAEQAKNAAAEASKKAETAAAAVDPLKQKAHTALINQADYLEKKNQADTERYAENVRTAQANANRAQEEYGAAQAAAEAARKKAEQSGNASDIVAAKNAATAAAAKQKEAAAARQKLEQETNNYNNAYIGQYSAKAEKSGLEDYSEVREQANTIRQQYTKQNTPANIARTAENNLKKAQQTAQQTAQNAEAKFNASEQAKRAAQAAADKAEKSGLSEDRRRADELRKRAIQAEKEAATAKAAALEAQKPLADLEKQARVAVISEARYNQKTYQVEKEEAERNIPSYRAIVTQTQKAMNDAYTVAQAKIAAAQANPNNDEAVVAARKAYDEYIRLQREALSAQKRLESEIRRRDTAESNYQAALEAQK